MMADVDTQGDVYTQGDADTQDLSNILPLQSAKYLCEASQAELGSLCRIAGIVIETIVGPNK